MQNENEKYKIEKNWDFYKISFIEKNENKLIISISKKNSYHIFESDSTLQQLKEYKLLSSSNSIREIIELITGLIDEKKININEKKNNIKLILLSPLRTQSNVELILNMKKKNYDELFDILIDKTNNLEEQNKNLILQIEKLSEKLEELKEENLLMKNRDNNIESNNLENNGIFQKLKTLENKIEILEDFHFIKDKRKIQLTSSNLKNINIIKEHKDWINSISTFPSGNIISVSDDKIIKIFNIHFNLIQEIIDSHDDNITYVNVKDENNFMTCSSDETIKFWTKKLNDFYLNKTIKNAHDAQINKVINFNDYIISCSKDKSIKFWEEKNESFYCIKSLNDESEINSILCLYDKNTLISSSEDSTKFWDLNNINNLNDDSNIIIKDCNCKNANTLVRIDEDNIITNGKDNYVNVISFSKQKIINEINIFTQCYGIYLVNDKGIFLIGATSNIRIYRKDNFECIQIIKNSHNDDIVGFNELKDGNIISYSADKTIKVWSF